MVDITRGKYHLKENFNLDKMEKLGEGSQGSVYKVKSLYDGQYYALKMQTVDNFQLFVDLIKEMLIMGQVGDHDNLTKIYKYYTWEDLEFQSNTCECGNCSISDSDSEQVSHIYGVATVMELGDTTLSKQKRNNIQQKINVTDQQVLDYLKQGLQGLKHLKLKNVHHRDIKPCNIILKNNIIKLVDFGLCKIFKDQKFEGITTEHSMEFSIQGTDGYFSPILEQGFYEGKMFQKHNLEKSDIFSLGLTFLEYLFNLEYDELVNFNTFSSKKSALIEKRINQIKTPQLKYLLQRMLEFNEKHRATIDECLEILNQNNVYQSQTKIDLNHNIFTSINNNSNKKSQQSSKNSEKQYNNDIIQNQQQPNKYVITSEESSSCSYYSSDSESNTNNKNNTNNLFSKNIFNNIFKNNEEQKIFNYPLENQKTIEKNNLIKNYQNIELKNFNYEGELKNNIPHGKGIQINKVTSEKYIGQFVDGKKCGQGCFYYSDGSIYDGEWYNDMKNGKGILFFNNGDITEGIWINDNQEGKHLIKNQKGSIIKNNFFDKGKLRKSIKI